MSDSAGRIELNKIFLQDAAVIRFAEDPPSRQNTEWPRPSLSAGSLALLP